MRFEELAVRIERELPGRYGIFCDPNALRATIIQELEKASNSLKLTPAEIASLSSLGKHGDYLIWTEDIKSVVRVLNGEGGKTWFRLEFRSGQTVLLDRDVVTRMICSD